jgi:hypothetical protein
VRCRHPDPRGAALFGPLHEASAQPIAQAVQLNVATLTELTCALLPGMRARDRGAIVNVASTAAFQPVPYMAVYGATKAYVLSFTEALWAETRGTGVRVTALCPGATDTAFFDTASDSASIGRRMAPGRWSRPRSAPWTAAAAWWSRGWETACWQAPPAWPPGRQSRG